MAESYANCVYSLVILEGVSYPQNRPFSCVRVIAQEVERKGGRTPANLPGRRELIAEAKHKEP